MMQGAKYNDIAKFLFKDLRDTLGWIAVDVTPTT